MNPAKLSFGTGDDAERIDECNAAARGIFEAHIASAAELIRRLEEEGFPVSDGLNNIPAILLARFSPMISAALQLAEIPLPDDSRETIHDLIRDMLSAPDAFTISRSPTTQASILKRVQAEFTLRSAAIEIEPTVTQEYGNLAGEIIVPPVVGNEPLLTAFREIAHATQDVERIVIITIRHIVLEGRLPFYEIIRMSR